MNGIIKGLTNLNVIFQAQDIPTFHPLPAFQLQTTPPVYLFQTNRVAESPVGAE